MIGEPLERCSQRPRTDIAAVSKGADTLAVVEQQRRNAGVRNLPGLPEGVDDSQEVIGREHGSITEGNVPHRSRATSSSGTKIVEGIVPRMTRDIRERISERLEELKKSARAASLDSGLGATAIKDILKRTDNSPTMATVEKLAVGLNVSPSWLAFEAGPKTLRIQNRGGLTSAGHLFTLARVDGAVKAGAFLRASAFDDDLGEAISAPRDPDYPAARQIAYRVDGDSMNAAKPRPIMDGDFIICAVWSDLDIQLTDGQIVVVQQTIDGGRLRERSVKAVFRVQGGWELRPMSTNAEHEAIFIPENDAPDDGREVVVLALVRFVFNNQVIR